MVNVILVTYGIMALGALAVAETIVGKDSRIQVVTLLSNEGLEELKSKVRIEFANGIGEDILVMTDIKVGYRGMFVSCWRTSIPLRWWQG